MALSFLDIKNDLFRMVGSKSDTTQAAVKNAVGTAIQRAQERFCLSQDWGFLEQLTDRVAIPLEVPYETGTVTVTLDSKTITGSGTTWTKDMEGQFFQKNSEEVYEIRKYISATSLILDIPYQSATAAGATYIILKRFYPIPLNFLRVTARDAKISVPGSQQETPINYHRDASFTDIIKKGSPLWFGIVGNTRNNNYWDTGTMTIGTSGTTSTWTASTGTLPSDIVDRQIRIHGESNAYWIDARLSSVALTTYDTYVNPDTQTHTLSSASNYAITPKETLLVGFSSVPSQRYIFWLPYIKRPDDLLLDSDISIIVLAGYTDAFLALCRKVLSEDARVAIRGDIVKNLEASSAEAMANAWIAEQHALTMGMQGTQKRLNRRQVGPSWIDR